MRLWLLPTLTLLSACGGELSSEQKDMIAQLESGTDLSRDELTDVMTMCEAMMDCYDADEDCPDDTDIRRHMSRRPLTDWGMIIVTEFKAKGVRPMEKELTAFIKDESLQMADWPCRDYYRVSSDRIRQAKLRR
jgi:hypothetical protein